MHRPICLLSFAVIALLGRPLQADDNWPAFRGPGGQGLAADCTPPKTFGPANNLEWQTAIPGQGWSSPVLFDDQLWLTTAVPNTDRQTLSLMAIGVDASNGQILQQVELFSLNEPEDIHDDNSYASPTPVVDADRVYCHFGTFGTAAIDRKTGAIVWKEDTLKIEHQGGPGSSPVATKDLLLLTLDGADKQYVIALNKADGSPVWRRERSAPFRENPITRRAFATPLLWTQNEQTILVSPAADQAHAYDALTGEELWHVRYRGFSNVPAPVADAEHVYLCTGFFEPVLGAIRWGGSGDVTETHLDWVYERSVSTIPSPILVEGRVFTVNESGILVCLDGTTGKVLRKKRLPGNYSASPICANGMLYFCSEEGKVSLVTADEQLEIIESNDLSDVIKASPAVSGNRLFIRTGSHLCCFQAAK